MAEKTVTIRILGDAKSGAGAFRDVEVSAGKADTSIGRIATTAAGFAIGGALTQLPGILMDGAKGAAEDEAAMGRLRQAVQNTGKSYDTYGGAIDDAIKRGQDLAFTDGETATALSTLIALTGDTDEGMRRLSLAQDLARGTGMDLDTAARLLGKTSEENTSALSRYGIQLGKNATAQDVLNAVDAKFGGQAGAFAESDAGKMAIAQQQVGELSESFGAMLLPVISLVAGVVLSLANTMQTSVIPAIQGFINTFSGLMPIFQPIIAFVQDNLTAVLIGLATMIGVIVVPAFVAWATAAGAAALATIVAMAPVIAIAAAVGIAVAALYLAWDTNFLGIRDIVQEVIGIIGPLISGIVDIAQGVIDFLSGDWKGAWDGVKTLVIDTVTGVIETLTTFVTDVTTKAQEVVSGFIGAFVNFVADVVQFYIDLYTGVFNKIVEIVTMVGEKAAEVVSSFLGAFASFVTDVVQFYIDVYTGILGKIGEIVTDVGTKAAEVVSAFLDAFVSFVTDAVQFYIDLYTRILEELGKLVTDVGTKAKEVVQGFIDGAKELFDDAVSAVTDIAGEITDFYLDAGTWLFDEGVDLVQGLIDGISSKITDLKNKVAELGGLLEIDVPFFSPPGHAGYEQGLDFIDGLTAGVSDGMPAFESAATAPADVMGTVPADVVANTWTSNLHGGGSVGISGAPSSAWTKTGMLQPGVLGLTDALGNSIMPGGGSAPGHEAFLAKLEAVLTRHEQQMERSVMRGIERGLAGA